MNIAKRFLALATVFFLTHGLASAAAGVQQQATKSEPEGFALISQKRYKEAEQYFKKLLEQSPKNVAFLNNHALALAGLESYEIALDELTEAIKLSPHDVNLYANRGDVFNLIHFYKRALSDYSKVVALDSKSIRGYKSRAAVFNACGEYSKAIEDFTTLSLLDKQNAALYLDNRSYSYKMVGKAAQALEDMNSAVKLAPHLQVVYLDRGALLAEMGNFKAALADYDRAVSLNPTSKPALLERAACYVKCQNYEKALADCDNVAKLTPNAEEAANLLRLSASALCGRSNYDQAIELASRSIDVLPSAAAYLVRARAHSKRGQFMLAVQDCDRVIQTRSSCVKDAYMIRAECMERLAARDRSLASSDKAVNGSPK